jgi:hypothetical protein
LPVVLILTPLGDDRPMIESPLLTEIVEEAMAKGEAKAKQQDIVEFLKARFGKVPEQALAYLRTIQDLGKLNDFIRLAARSADLASFEEHVSK